MTVTEFIVEDAATRPAINGSKKVALPDELKILEAFHRLCAPLSERAKGDRIQSCTLSASLRDTLLPKALSGELNMAWLIGKVRFSE